jgi:NADPH:quinone reductase
MGAGKVKSGISMKVTRFHQFGGPENLVYEDVDPPQPMAGQALIKIEACGLNYIDTYHRTGLYPVELPCTPGMEAAGTVAALGDGVVTVKVGDRVAYAGVLGSYAEYAAVEAERLVPLPDELDFEHAAAAMLQGMTAHYLSHGSYALKPGDTALVHAAAGGVGLLLVQMAKRCGARVIGTVSTAAKEELARQAGADEIVRYTETDFVAATLQLTGGAGVDVVYDSVGKTTFEKGLDLLRPLGYMVLFGQSSGPVPPFDLGGLAPKGSLFVTRPTMAHYIQTRQDLLARAGEVLAWVGNGELTLRIGDRFDLADAAEAHRALEGRKTTGKVVLLP